ncbi:Phosphorylase superfamily protein [Halogranum gelatinilyticum]|uniref:Phosphorylase superfamily protein n=1 Tax=Halogranum gelatinilyticum TaxID=660521 RepID=A0A1G9U9T7_9EURY|nr:nucleoside phosphorylase [Halogranum gelatinilyticum]SDM56711.1 Phosphorylase superfamily protein [Halogranum gelatinilyticum]
MPVPNVPEKLEHPSVTSPATVTDYRGKRNLDAAPETVVLSYQRALADHVRTAHETTTLPHAGSSWNLHALDETGGRVAVAEGFGIGAPMTATVMERLVAQGTRRFVIVGESGSLQPDVRVGATVVADAAIRDEGTSYHYLPDDAEARATPAVRDRLTDAVESDGRTAHVGPTWTTDALYRETALEIEHYRDAGVLTVDMEAAAVFAVAQARDIEAGALFTVSDHLTPDGWEPHFADTDDQLADLFDLVAATFG